MSDLPGLALALAAQACLLTAWWWQTPDDHGDRRMTPDTLAASGRMIVLGALLAGVAVGLRTQTLWLTRAAAGRSSWSTASAAASPARSWAAAMTFTIGGAGCGASRSCWPAAGCRPTWPRWAPRRARTSPAARCST